MKTLDLDRIRYGGSKPPKLAVYFRKAQDAEFLPLKLLYRFLFSYNKSRNLCDISVKCKIGPGAYFGHPYCIIINSDTIIGKNVSFHNGVTIGKENRGERKGVPTIGDEVWIGANATIVGKVNIGNDVLIAPNAFVNIDVPDHSVVIGNPAKIIHNEHATLYYSTNNVP